MWLTALWNLYKKFLTSIHRIFWPNPVRLIVFSKAPNYFRQHILNLRFLPHTKSLTITLKKAMNYNYFRKPRYTSIIIHKLPSLSIILHHGVKVQHLTIIYKDLNVLNCTLTTLKLSHDNKFLSSTHYMKGDPEPETCISLVLDQKPTVHLVSKNRLLKKAVYVSSLLKYPLLLLVWGYYLWNLGCKYTLPFCEIISIPEKHLRKRRKKQAPCRLIWDNNSGLRAARRKLEEKSLKV
jgi:hypothetical protein